ncbi:probable WRKY transcription factor 40 isoform X2 [Coffea arabica]|uniref:Probable WRKY transcription factor 40 isoform X2 n=1 Tax=Coffea arabica TaxID=13443 RepID=A0A6P6TWT6_COFAR|nr:probable WRKY transcription factor 40 isoform X2 [Coffea arabica]
MDTILEEDCLAFDLNMAPARNTSDSLKPEFDDGHDLVLDESKSTSGEEQPDILIDQLNQIKSENKKLKEMLIDLSENYHILQSHFIDLVQKYSGDELPKSRKRMFEAENSFNTHTNDGHEDSVLEEGGSPKRPREIRTNISRVHVRVDLSDTSLVVKDGYHWRKYGQKVTKDNPSPRAYYKCSFAPSCQVKKKVQRSVGDPSILIATYEGEHNHQHPLNAETLVSSAHGAASAAFSPGLKCFEFSSRPKETVDFTNHGLCAKFQRSVSEIGSNCIEQLMVEQIVSSLTRNPSFTTALATAISGRLLSHDSDQKK